MDPATLAIAATVGSTAVSALGSIQQGNAASASAGYNAQVASNNAKIATQNAQLVGAQGEQAVGAAGAETRAKVGATVAGQGASGIDVNTGSAVDVRESEAKLGMLSALNIRSQAAQKAYGFQTEAAADVGQENLDKSQQSYDKTAGYVGAATDILGGAGKAAAFSNFLSAGDPTSGITNTVSNNAGNPNLLPGFMTDD